MFCSVNYDLSHFVVKFFPQNTHIPPTSLVL
jgi:hypothetical protein